MFFDIDAHKDCFKTNPDAAYFWHGQTDGIGGQNNAMEIASQNNGKTLEMCMLENRDELEDAGVRFRDNSNGTVDISYGSNEEENNRFWDDCSKSFAEQASGNIHVIDGSDPRQNGQSEKEYPCVYNRLEHPTLEQNEDVNSITHIDPKSQEATEVENLNHNNSEQEAQNHPKTPIQQEAENADEILKEQPKSEEQDLETGKQNQQSPIQAEAEHADELAKGNAEETDNTLSNVANENSLAAPENTNENAPKQEQGIEQ